VVVAAKWTMDGAVAYVIARLSGPPYAVFAHGTELIWHGEGPVVRACARRILGAATAVFVVSDYTHNLLNHLLRPLHLAAVRKFTGFLRQASVAGPTDEGPMNALPRDALVLLTVARLERRKGHEFVIRALADLAGDHPNVHYCFTGDPARALHLLELAEEWRVGGKVHCLGILNDDQLRAAYGRAAIYVGLGVEDRRDVEGLGLVFAEAHLHGLPVVAGDVGGVHEIVVDGENGFLVDATDADQVHDRLDQLLSQPELRRRMGERGREMALDGLEVHRQIASLIQLLPIGMGRERAGQ
jgi:phosphatidylinositol alpha-1,6-mannosyltransferase